MSADLHIHALPDASKLPLLLDYARGTDAEWDAIPMGDDATDEERAVAWDRLDARSKELDALVKELDLWRLPDVWIGQVSWMKAGFLREGPEDWRRYVPRVVEVIQRHYDEGGGVRVMTPGLTALITTAFNLPHESWYEHPRRYFYDNPRNEPTGKWYDRQKLSSNGVWFGTRYPMRGINKARQVKKWCHEHMGEHTFLISQ